MIWEPMQLEYMINLALGKLCGIEAPVLIKSNLLATKENCLVSSQFLAK